MMYNFNMGLMATKDKIKMHSFHAKSVIALYQIAIVMYKFHNNVLPAAFHFSSSSCFLFFFVLLPR